MKLIVCLAVGFSTMFKIFFMRWWCKSICSVSMLCSDWSAARHSWYPQGYQLLQSVITFLTLGKLRLDVWWSYVILELQTAILACIWFLYLWNQKNAFLPDRSKHIYGLCITAENKISGETPLSSLKTTQTSVFHFHSDLCDTFLSPRKKKTIIYMGDLWGVLAL